MALKAWGIVNVDVGLQEAFCAITDSGQTNKFVCFSLPNVDAVNVKGRDGFLTDQG